MLDQPAPNHPDLSADPAAEPLPKLSLQRLVAITVNNTRTRAGLFVKGELEESQSFTESHPAELAAAIKQRFFKDDDTVTEKPVVVLASVRPSVSTPLAQRLEVETNASIYHIGKDLPIKLNHRLDDDGAKTVGQDRLLTALGAFSRTRQATVVVDVGTATTIDFVDGEGTFCGGAIMPGIDMMLDALHDHTEQLPRPDFTQIEETFGANTPDAMNLGAQAAIIGAVHALTERYALAYGGYPQIVCTGGNAAILESDEVIEHIVPDLQLLGVAEACRLALEEDDANNA